MSITGFIGSGLSKASKGVGKALNMFFPVAGHSYENAQTTTSRGTPQAPAPTDAKFELDDWTRAELMRRARWVEKNSGTIVSVLKDFKIYGVGRGVYPVAQSDDKEWNRQAERYFYRWAKMPDYAGRYTWREMQGMATRLLKVDGEFFVIKTFDKFGSPKIEMLESHRLGAGLSNYDAQDGNYVSDGVEFDKRGAVVAYHFLTDESFTPKRYLASAVLHVFEATRPSAARAHSQIQHAINDIIDRKEILALEKKKVKAISDIVGVLKGSSKGPTADFQVAGVQADSATDIRSVARIIGGKNVRINGDEDYDIKTPTTPSSTFNGFVADLERTAHLGVEPYEMSDPTKIGGAAVRLVCAKAQRYVDDDSYTLDERFYSRVWFFVIGCAIDRGELEPVKWWWDTNWTHPKRLTVDTGRDGQNDRADIDMGLKNVRQSYAENGLDFEDEITKRAEDFALMKEIADKHGIDFSLLYKPSGTQVIIDNSNKNKNEDDEK